MTIQTNFSKFLITTATILRKSRVGDGEGGFIENDTTIATEPSRIHPVTSRDTLLGERWDAQISHVGFFEDGVDVKRDDKISADGRILRVVAVREPSFLGHHLEVDLELIQVNNDA